MARGGLECWYDVMMLLLAQWDHDGLARCGVVIGSMVWSNDLLVVVSSDGWHGQVSD